MNNRVYNKDEMFEKLEKELKSILIQIKDNGPYAICRSGENKSSIVSLQKV